MAALINAVAGNVLDAAGVARSWSGGLCDCSSDCSSACDIYWCTPCMASRMCEAIDGREDTNDCCLCFVIYMLQQQNFIAMVATILRYRIVAKYNIGGEGVIMTYCMGMCCPLCSMCQTWRTLTAMMVWPGGSCCATIRPGPLGAVVMK